LGSAARSWFRVKESDVAVSSDSCSEYGYLLLVVYPSRIHTTLPSTTAGYGLPSTVSHGATFSTRSRGLRSYRILDSEFTRLDSTILGSPNLNAYRNLRKIEPTRTPPLPS